MPMERGPPFPVTDMRSVPCIELLTLAPLHKCLNGQLHGFKIYLVSMAVYMFWFSHLNHGDWEVWHLPQKDTIIFLSYSM